ncbi:GNAT family N-acetyltransferase [Roseicyclus persicicus]|uniref:GNAT family N-acetyltransferase n=1 Tax=Roseicyclus persicicus TaxID=2650661 RepID=A0A7X6H0R1_9RHOB|nr:GNAT family N-acetyltransferase [Roseibacterium persicicum]NKX45830.1 GNAT family N-acetyltransferase [Roseibacterium persicicum]
MTAPGPCPLQQSDLYAAALARIGAGVARHGPVLALHRAWPGLGRVALVSRAADLPGDLRAALAARVLIVNAASPAQGAALARAGLIRLARPRGVAMLSLDGTLDDWLARMDGKWRNRLRHGQRQGLAVGQGPMPPDPHHWLLACEAAQQAARGYRNLPPTLIAAMAAAEPGALTLATAQLHRRTVAAMLFARHGGTATYLVGWADAAGRAASAHGLLLWRAMGELRAAGVSAVDLGACDARQSPGLARFKLGSGAEMRPMGGTWAEAGALAPLHAGLRAARRVSGKAARTPATPPCTGHAECS